MLRLTLIFAGVVAAAPSPSASDTLRAYRSESEATPRDASSQFRLALWCEAHGLEPERTKHLALAVLLDPGHAGARGLMGLLAFEGRWESPEAVARRLKNDEVRVAKLATYNGLREAMDRTLSTLGPLQPCTREGRRAASAHARLGAWCESNGLGPEATAHFTQAVLLDPYRDTSWKHLGYVRHDGRWLTPAQVAEEETDARIQKQADLDWGHRLKLLRARLRKGEAGAVDDLNPQGVPDARAVPSIVRVLGGGGEPEQSSAVELLARIETPRSSRELATLAVRSPFPGVRKVASEVLRRRDPRDFGEMLVGLIQTPMRYDLRPVAGPGSPGFLCVETPRYKMIRGYDAPPVFNPGSNFFGYVGLDPNGLPVIVRGVELRALNQPKNHSVSLAAIEVRTQAMIAEANVKAAVSQDRLVADVYAIESANAETASVNERAVAVLKDALEAPDLGNNEDKWRSWWFDRVGYRYEPAPQIVLTVNASPQYPPPSLASCFASGTPVRTLDGHRPIEAIRVGDQVLAQDVTTGSLSYRPVTVVHHNAPAETIKVTLDDGDTLVASTYHRFYRAGRGWAMAKELETGDTLRTLGGTSRVVSLEKGRSVPVFNLDVADSRTYFVGDHDALVHDNTLPPVNSPRFDVLAVSQK